MSLKAFHLVFVTALTALSFGCAALFVRDYMESKAKLDLALAVVAVLCGVAVLVYGKYFLKKLKKLSYL